MVWRLLQSAESANQYESCIVQGVASEAVGEEKQRSLEGLMHEYSADFVAEGWTISSNGGRGLGSFALPSS
jgi:hypothetical protein